MDKIGKLEIVKALSAQLLTHWVNDVATADMRASLSAIVGKGIAELNTSRSKISLRYNMEEVDLILDKIEAMTPLHIRGINQNLSATEIAEARDALRESKQR